MPCSHVAMLECHWLFISPSPAGADISSNAPFTMDQRSPSHTAFQTREGMCWHRDQTGHPHAVKWDFPALSVDLFRRSTVSTPRPPLIEKVKEHKRDWSRPQKHSWHMADDASFSWGGQLIAVHKEPEKSICRFPACLQMSKAEHVWCLRTQAISTDLWPCLIWYFIFCLPDHSILSEISACFLREILINGTNPGKLHVALVHVITFRLDYNVSLSGCSDVFLKKHYLIRS